MDYKKIWSEVLTGSLIIIISAIAIISFVVISGQDVDVYNPSSKVEVRKGSEKITEILTLIESKYAGEVSVDDLIDGAVDGIFSKIDDPYTRYLTKEEFDEEVGITGTSYGGIGIHVSLDSKTKQAVIIGVMNGTPAAKAGLRSGDIITKVDDVNITKENFNTATDYIRGEKDTKVYIEVLSKGTKKTFTITRENIEANNISTELLDGNIGYIRIYEFGKDIYSQFKNEYDELIKQKKVKGLIIDVRNNPGGFVTDTVKIADILCKEGVIMEEVAKDGSKKVYKSDKSGIEVPLVILANENSASAAEILSGAVKDLKAGRIVGKNTFGKGIVQSIIPLSSGAGVSITTAKYYTASGEEIHEVGIKPDVEVEQNKDFDNEYIIDTKNDYQLKKGIEVIMKSIK